MTMETLHDLLVNELKDLYSAENQMIKVLPTLASTANNAQLREALAMHLQQTHEQARRIEAIFRAGLDGSPRGKKCAAMEGLIEETKDILHEKSAPDVLDAALIGAAQRVEHYEIAGYGTARAHAQQLGYLNAVHLLQQTLEEESAADEKLTQIAESSINVSAAQKHLRAAESEAVRSH